MHVLCVPLQSKPPHKLLKNNTKDNVEDVHILQVFDGQPKQARKQKRGESDKRSYDHQQEEHGAVRDKLDNESPWYAKAH